MDVSGKSEAISSEYSSYGQEACNSLSFFFTAMITGLDSVIGDETKWRKKINILSFPLLKVNLNFYSFIHLYIY